MKVQHKTFHLGRYILFQLFVFSLFCVVLIKPGFAEHPQSKFQIATFSADVTPPLGHPLLGGLYEATKGITDPLFAKGFVLFGSDKPIVFVTIDWCEIRNEAYDQWRKELAKAAWTTSERVLLSCVHQHDAPLSDLEAQKLLDSVNLNKELIDVAFQQRAIQDVADAIRDTCQNRKQVITHIGLGKAPVENVSSSRRVVHSDGRVSFSRGSTTPDESIRNLPVGTIDPLLRTLSFWNGEKCIMAAHFYAVHPMSYYGKGMVSSDFVGLARERLQHETPSIFQIYVSGCSGDVTGGKYNVGGEPGRRYLTKQVYQGMKDSFQTTQKTKLKQIEFRSVPLILPPRDKGDFTIEAMQKVLNNPKAHIRDRVLAALGLSWRKRVARNQPLEIPVIDFSVAQLMLMPGETFVGYQLAAQKLRPDVSVFVAGYGECATGYIPTASAVRDGFDNRWYWVSQDVKNESLMHNAMKKALQAK